MKSVHGKIKRLAFVLAVCAVMGVPALAGPTIGDTVQVTYTGSSPGAWVNVVTPVFSGDMIAGIHNITVDGKSRSAFCIEYDQLASTTTLPYEVTAVESAPLPGPSMGPAQAVDIMKVWSWWEASDGSDMSAAIAQCTVWEITDDGDFLTGGFQLNTEDVRIQAEALLAALPGLTDYTRMVALTSPDAQDFAVPVPAPGAFLLAGLGASLVGHLRRRRAL